MNQRLIISNKLNSNKPTIYTKLIGKLLSVLKFIIDEAKTKKSRVRKRQKRNDPIVSSSSVSRYKDDRRYGLLHLPRSIIPNPQTYRSLNDPTLSPATIAEERRCPPTPHEDAAQEVAAVGQEAPPHAVPAAAGSPAGLDARRRRRHGRRVGAGRGCG